MGSRLAVLIVFVLGVFTVAAEAFAENSCLRCHQPHAEGRIDCIGCHRGDPRSVRMNIAHRNFIPARFAHFQLPDSGVAEAGRKLLDSAACRRCHVWAERGNRLAAGLDQSARHIDPPGLVEAIREPAAFMPDFDFSEDQVTAVVNALLIAGLQAPLLSGDQPQVIHFASRRSDEENPFAKHCGGCHRLLTDRHGGLGTGDVAPHLAGLLSEFYPRTFKEDERWTSETLKKWLDNPRQSRPAATMTPIRLNDEEFAALLPVIQLPERGEAGDKDEKH